MKKQFTISENIYHEVHEYLHGHFCGKKNINEAKVCLLTEECLKSLINHKSEKADTLTVTFQNVFGNTKVILSCEGEKYSLSDYSDVDGGLKLEKVSEESDAEVRNLILQKLSNQIRYLHFNDRNIITITGEKDERKEITFTLCALVLGIIVGLALKYCAPLTFSESILEGIFGTISSIFVKALRMLVGPIVFFAMVCCISQFRSISEIGKTGVRLLGLYAFTTILAVCVGFLLFHIFPVGNPAIANKLQTVVEETMENDEEAEELIEAAEAVENNSFTAKNVVTNIIPNSIIEPFADSNLLQILLLSILVGIGVSAVAAEHPALKDFFEGMNGVFLAIMDILCKLIPLAIFCNMALLVFRTGLEVLKSIAGFATLAISGIIVMMILYNLLILTIGGLNPVPFMCKYAKTSITALCLSSSTAAMPVSMESCRKLGISGKIVSLAIPLGSTINMDGSSLVMSIACLYMARIFSIDITPALLLSILISVVLLSLGAPSMAGADLAIIAILISQIGVPVYAIALIMGIDTILDMCQAMSNTTGDAAIALILAKKTGNLDLEKYNEK